MAPSKNTRAVQKPAATVLPNVRKDALKKLVKKTQSIQDQNVDIVITRGKRKADQSPLKNDKVKRSALGNLTNNVNTLHLDDEVKQISKEKIAILQKREISTNYFGPQALGVRPAKITTRAATRNLANNRILDENKIHAAAAAADRHIPTIVKKGKVEEGNAGSQKPQQNQMPARRISNEFNKTEESLYMSALEDISSSESMRLSGNFLEVARRRSALAKQNELKLKTEDYNNEVDAMPKAVSKIPKGVDDFDRATWNDPIQVSNYAMEIFDYLKTREPEFEISDYMSKQPHLSKWMRSLLVDWMVEVQETFELNHETLYLAVKIVDSFLCKVVLHKDKLQLLGAAALFIACKFDERSPPLIEDFLYICAGAYKHNELIKMEMMTLKTIDYDLGIPLSYRFLRRYARCAKVPMSTLTLARYILELALMDYATISFSDSKMAAAALFMALRLYGEKNTWSPTLLYYSGYQLVDFAEIVPVLNAGLHRKPKDTIKTIRSKYSHQIFHEVAKVPLMSTEKLFEGTDLDASIELNENSS